MFDFYFLFLIKGAESESEVNDEEEMPDIGPVIDVNSSPGLLIKPQPFSLAGNNGRLLSVADGCGISKAGNTRIVGGTPAKIAAYPWLALIGYINGSEITFKCGKNIFLLKNTANFWIFKMIHPLFKKNAYRRIFDNITTRSHCRPLHYASFVHGSAWRTRFFKNN